MRRISNSEAMAWLSCRRKYYYGFDLNLQPRRFGTSISRGILFHLCMEAFNTVYADTGNYDKASDAGMTVLRRELAKDDEFSDEVVLDTRRIYTMYIAWLYERINEWEILEAEQEYDLPISPEFSLPIRLDLLVRVRTTGEVALVDYKTCYDFWSDGAIALSPQAPKYIAALRAAGKPVDTLLLEQVRYRKVKDPSIQLIRRTPIKPNSAKIRNVLKEHIAVSREITAYRELPVETHSDRALRVLNPQVACKYCYFQTLCTAELTGGDASYEMQVNYKKNTYDYNQTLELEMAEM